jgi:hypothetical protein
VGLCARRRLQAHPPLAVLGRNIEREQALAVEALHARDELRGGRDLEEGVGAVGAATRVRCVSVFLDQNRRYIGKSQSERPPNRTQRTPHPLVEACPYRMSDEVQSCMLKHIRCPPTSQMKLAPAALLPWYGFSCHRLLPSHAPSVLPRRFHLLSVVPRTCVI